MKAFERIKSGISSMDKLLDNIRIGDNVVIQVAALNDYKKMAQAFTKQAIDDNRNISYIRFAKHEPILEEQDGLKIYRLDAKKGFESFTVDVHTIIEKEGYEAFYVFDCLSDLQVAWSTDLMMGNFFCVTCPYLFELDTVAFFPVLRGHHDYTTIARIQETTQLLLNVYSNEKATYLHPIKVWNRYSSEMYVPHKFNEKDELEPLTSSVKFAEFYRLIHLEQADFTEQNIDSYDRFFKEAKNTYFNGGISDFILNKIILSMMTHDRKMALKIKEEFSPEELFFIKERMIGTGVIGGKSCGMLLSRKMVENYLPHYSNIIEPHDSFYIGTDVFYSFIVENRLWKLRIMQSREENYFSLAEEMTEAILSGKFPEIIRAQFRRMLEYFGQIPIIVRSSSFLEDGFGGAFAGKYESVFCANGSGPVERLENFENAVRRVYASTMNPSALEYRRKKGMANIDEQMAILVQRVSGTQFGDYYMPCAAGVGFSYSVYRWNNDLSADAGLLRLVAGMGTRAVDRTGTDYPRLVNLDNPENNPLVSDEEKHRFSQRIFDVIHVKANKFEQINAADFLKSLPSWYTELISEHDYTAESFLREKGRNDAVRFVSCNGVVKIKILMDLMKEILATLQEHYETPVDIEYTVNFSPDGTFVVNLLQCRPLFIWQTAVDQLIPEIDKEDILFQVTRDFMGSNTKLQVDVVVWIDSKSYFDLPYHEKSKIARMIGNINQYYKDSGKKLMLISPGRIGTSSFELGVAVNFSEISNFGVLCEYEDAEIGFTPELSYGSHLFQDLVEAEMFYVAIIEGKGVDDALFNKNFWSEKESVLNEILPHIENPRNIVRVYETKTEKQLKIVADIKNRTAVCGYFKQDR